jgi:hypothetical protein
MNGLAPTNECTPPEVPPVEISLNKTTPTSGSLSWPDVPRDVPPVAININKENSTSGTPGGTGGPEVGCSVGPAEKNVRTIFRESKTFKNYFDANSTDEVMNMFLDVHTNFLELPETHEWKLFCEWMLDRFIQERKNKKLQEIQDVLLDMINQDFYTPKTKERLRNMKVSDAIEYIIENINTYYELHVLEPKIQRYMKHVRELNGNIITERSEAIENTPNNAK